MRKENPKKLSISLSKSACFPLLNSSLSLELRNLERIGSCWKRHTGQHDIIFQLLQCKFQLIKASLKYVSPFYSGHWAEVLISKTILLTHILSQDAFLFCHVWVSGKKKMQRTIQLPQSLGAASELLQQDTRVPRNLNNLLWPQVT